MPVEIKMKSDDARVVKRIEELYKRTGDFRGVTRIIGEIGLTSIQRNFEVGGRPRRWKALAASTIRSRKRQHKWPGQILVRRGVGGGLLGSISYRVRPHAVIFSTKKIYAAIHHFGGQAGRGHKVTIPARPYMLFQREDREEMREALRSYLLR